jgi:putative transcriptional regulator
MPLISIKEARVIAKGHAARRFEMTAPDAKAVREQTGLLQGDCAKRMRVSVKTLQNCEPHRVSRRPVDLSQTRSV